MVGSSLQKRPLEELHSDKRDFFNKLFLPDGDFLRETKLASEENNFTLYWKWLTTEKRFLVCTKYLLWFEKLENFQNHLDYEDIL